MRTLNFPEGTFVVITTSEEQRHLPSETVRLSYAASCAKCSDDGQLIHFREPIAVRGEDQIVLDPDFLA